MSLAFKCWCQEVTWNIPPLWKIISNARETLTWLQGVNQNSNNNWKKQKTNCKMTTMRLSSGRHCLLVLFSQMSCMTLQKQFIRALYFLPPINLSTSIRQVKLVILYCCHSLNKSLMSMLLRGLDTLSQCQSQSLHTQPNKWKDSVCLCPVKWLCGQVMQCLFSSVTDRCALLIKWYTCSHFVLYCSSWKTQWWVILLARQSFWSIIVGLPLEV